MSGPAAVLSWAPDYRGGSTIREGALRSAALRAGRRAANLAAGLQLPAGARRALGTVAAKNVASVTIPAITLSARERMIVCAHCDASPIGFPTATWNGVPLSFRVSSTSAGAKQRSWERLPGAAGIGDLVITASAPSAYFLAFATAIRGSAPGEILMYGGFDSDDRPISGNGSTFAAGAIVIGGASWRRAAGALGTVAWDAPLAQGQFVSTGSSGAEAGLSECYRYLPDAAATLDIASTLTEGAAEWLAGTTGMLALTAQMRTSALRGGRRSATLAVA